MPQLDKFIFFHQVCSITLFFLILYFFFFFKYLPTLSKNLLIKDFFLINYKISILNKWNFIYLFVYNNVNYIYNVSYLISRNLKNNVLYYNYYFKMNYFNLVLTNFIKFINNKFIAINFNKLFFENFR